MKHPKTLQKEDTLYSADSVEFQPGTREIFVCGTYQIEKLDPPPAVAAPDGEVEEGSDDESVGAGSPEMRRLGRALVYKVNEDRQGFTEVQRFDGPAILDTKWSHLGAPGPSRLAIANAEGQVTVHTWSPEKEQLEHQQTIQVEEDSSILVLSLDWSDQLHPSTSTSLITSLSSGSLSLLSPSATGELEVATTWKAHEYEPWIVSWDRWERDVVWSGGDDCVLKSWDVRSPMMPSSMNKNFDGGVTTIASSPHTEHLLAVGSYDAHLRLFDTRSLRQPLRTIPTGGGVWRTKFHPSPDRSGDILLACMHGGFRVLHLDSTLTGGEGWGVTEEGEVEEEAVKGEGWEVAARFDDHESIAYGVDWGMEVRGGGESLVGSCSFYDHELRLWSV